MNKGKCTAEIPQFKLHVSSEANQRKIKRHHTISCSVQQLQNIHIKQNRTVENSWMLAIFTISEWLHTC